MAGALDQRLRSERVELDVSNTDGTLLPGMVAEVSIPLKSRNLPFVVPKSAVVTAAEGIFVIKVVNHIAQRIKIELGLEVNDEIEIFSELLSTKDTLLVKASEEIRNGGHINN